MLHQDADSGTVQSFAKTHPQEPLSLATNEVVVLPAGTIRYMDDDVFQRGLDEVIAVHGRLLAKLAE